MKQETMKLGKLEIDMYDLRRFIVKSKKKGYAGQGIYKRAKDGSKIFTFQKGNFYYTDNYAGSPQAPGDEIVRWQKEDGQRIWHMHYSGGMLEKFWEDEELSEKSFVFLKKMISQIPFRYPFRGPIGRSEDKDFIYSNRVNGDIKRFGGNEKIYSKILKEIIFTQDYNGCLVVPK
ncbi:hypothetical protein ES703_97480 [subsurface metagenome]